MRILLSLPPVRRVGDAFACPDHRVTGEGDAGAARVPVGVDEVHVTLTQFEDGGVAVGADCEGADLAQPADDSGRGDGDALDDVAQR